MNNRLQRDSNAELLRIIAMLLILLHHFAVHALYPEVLSNPQSTDSWDTQLILFLHGFLYIGVNVFVLISGYYGIKTKWRSFFNLYLTYAFYQFIRSIRLFLGILKRGDAYTIGEVIWDSLVRIFMPFTHGYLWFLDCYLALFLLAPLLNAAIGAINKQQHGYILVLLTIVNVYLGFYFGKFGNHGYTVSNFVYIYMIGSYINRYISATDIEAHRWTYFAIFIVSGIVYGAMRIINLHSIHIPYSSTWAYNDPIVLTTAISCFLFVMSFHFHSKTVNWIAASTLGVYILNELVIKYQLFLPFAQRYSHAINLFVWLGISVAFFIVAICADKIRVFICKPIWLLHDKLYPKIVSSNIFTKFSSAIQ